MNRRPPRPTVRAAVLAGALALGGPAAATLAQSAKESGCVDKPVRMVGSNMWKCTTASGALAFFNVPEGSEIAPPPKTATKAPAASPSSFPRIDAGTQKSRDDLRRKVLSDELAGEEKLLAEAKSAYGDGAPAPLPEERADAQRYAERIARLRQSIQLHQRNIEALKRELAAR
ncbi:MAG: DUF4124 domain-containing protein [Burkholderiales bacterium]